MEADLTPEEKYSTAIVSVLFRFAHASCLAISGANPSCDKFRKEPATDREQISYSCKITLSNDL
jgi:hypothetical protein